MPDTPLPDEPRSDARRWGDAAVRFRGAARWTLGRGVASRLLLALLLPVAALALAAGVLVTERYDTASRASSIRADIRLLTGTVRLRTLLDQERLPVEASLRERELGLPAAGNSAGVVGLAMVPETSARAAVDAELHKLGDAVPSAFAPRLAGLRRAIDSAGLSARDVDRAYSGLSEQLARVFGARLEVLERRAAGQEGSAALDGALRTLGDADEVLGAGSAETADASNLYFDAPAQHLSDAGALVAQRALFADASTRLEADAGEPVHAAFARLVAGDGWRHFQSVAATAGSGGPRLFPSPAGRPRRGIERQLLGMVSVFSGGIEGVHGLYRLVQLAAADTTAAATRLQQASNAALEDLLLIAIIGVGITVAVALLLARSISRPLRRLEGHALAVSTGHLELAALEPRGPKETIVASRAFNELVSNLRLLEAKARKLAECRFDDPVLAEPLPGHLGEALQQSVAVLSGSILEREQLSERLTQEATHDALTGLHNRSAAVGFLDQALARAARTGDSVAVLYIDLDGFKSANDTYGHAVGDAILRQVAARMETAARRGDFLGRVGGDEFVVIAEGVGDPAKAGAIADRLLASVSEPVRVDGLRMAVGACVGIAFALDAAADDSSQLLARADLALYRAKQTGGPSVRIYDASLQRDLVERAGIEKDLRTALEEGGAGLSLHYQPIIDAASGETACVEALVRWDRPGHGPCSPGEFIPVAEASDLIIQIDRWVLAEALAAQRAWRESGIGRIRVAVNISGRHLLSGRLVEDVTEALEASGATPGEVTLEITETVLLTDLPAVALELDRLRSAGLRVAIDDFGTGFTSLAHLRHLTVDEIKIDRSFVSGAPEGRDRSLVRLVIDIGHRLGAFVVAEGIEEEDQLAELRAADCDLLQGFLIARPLSAEDLVAWLAERREQQTSLPGELAV